MSIELPVLRLGLAGFSADQQDKLGAMLERISPPHVVWLRTRFSDADAWWFNGARTQMQADGILRIQPGVPTERSTVLSLPDVDRPVAFSRPLLARGFDPLYAFDLDKPGEMRFVLEKFGAWLRPLVAQFCLAAQVVEQESALGTGIFNLTLNGTLLAVVDMRGDVGVLPTASPADFHEAIWTRRSASDMPEHFVRTSLAQLMWQYAVRTARDVLPKHYRTAQLYFRRPPRLPQRLLKDSHLLVMRELAVQPASFDELANRTGLPPGGLARDLAALYFVGSITSNPKRVGGTGRTDGPVISRLPAGAASSFDSSSPPAGEGNKLPLYPDLTAPAPIGPG